MALSDDEKRFLGEAARQHAQYRATSGEKNPPSSHEVYRQLCAGREAENTKRGRR